MTSHHDADFKAKRVTRQYVQTIHAEPSMVHSLICPVKEAEWLDGWDYNLIYSQSGVAEPGCVFTSMSAGEETIWMITKRDDEAFETEFARVTPGSRVAVVSIRIENGNHQTSRVYISYSITALTAAGNQVIDSFTQENFDKDMQFWEATMNHYLRTGKALPLSHAENWLKYTSENSGSKEEQ